MTKHENYTDAPIESVSVSVLSASIGNIGINIGDGKILGINIGLVVCCITRDALKPVKFRSFSGIG